MKRTLLYLIIAIISINFANAQQVISIVGTGVNGWPPTTGAEIDLTTSDEITYTLTGQVVTTGVVKFRLNHAWDSNWGSASFPDGIGTNNGQNIPTIAGTYDITFNRITGAYSFIGAQEFPNIGIWGPAVDAINGFGGADVNMSTTDGITYKLSAFNFTSGTANFRQNDNPLTIFSSTSFPAGVAVASGPNFFVTGGQWTVYFNRITGAYSFEYPSVGLIGTFNNWTDPDVNMTTTNGEIYTLQNVALDNGFCKLRLDDKWTINWGGDVFPNGTLDLNSNIDIAVVAGTYDVIFNRATNSITFTSSLGTNQAQLEKFGVYPNPTQNAWYFSGSNSVIEQIQIFDITGKAVLSELPNASEAVLSAAELQSGIYFARISTAEFTQTIKVLKQ